MDWYRPGAKPRAVPELIFLSDPSPKSTLLVPAYSNRIWSNAWTNILVVFLENFLVFVYVLWVCFKCRFFVFDLVVYLHLFSAAYGNKALNTTVNLCLHSPHHKVKECGQGVEVHPDCEAKPRSISAAWPVAAPAINPVAAPALSPVAAPALSPVAAPALCSPVAAPALCSPVACHSLSLVADRGKLDCCINNCHPHTDCNMAPRRRNSKWLGHLPKEQSPNRWII